MPQKVLVYKRHKEEHKNTKSNLADGKSLDVLSEIPSLMLLCFLCSSLCLLWLIIVSFHEPVLGFELAIDAIECLASEALECHVPFVARPAIVAPPVTRSSPWPSQVNHFPVNTALLTPRADLRGPTLLHFNNRSQWWAKPAKAQALPRLNRLRLALPAAPAIGLGLQRESLHAERVRTMSVEQSR